MQNLNSIENVLKGFSSDFVKALAEPVRIEILKQLIVHGESDVKNLAEKMPQDRSVISRHLALMEKAGLLKVKKAGRHVIYALDGEQALSKAEQIVETIRQCLRGSCC